MTQEQKGAFITFGKALGAAFMASLSTASMMLLILDRLYVTKAEMMQEQIHVAQLDGNVALQSLLNIDLKNDLVQIRGQLRDIEQKLK